jgi:hypothetical protein
MESSTGSHRWHFFRAGGVDQVRLETGADIVNLHQLDQKLWVALACPVKGLEFDEKTLALIDSDKDGRIRVPEIIAAAKWAGAMLKNADELTKGGDLPLGSINDAMPEGSQLVASAKQILSNLGKASATSICVADTMETAKVFAQTKFNGDGVLPVESVDDPEAKATAADIVACLGGELDRSGKPGITQARLDQFITEATAHSDWWKKAESDSASVLPLAEATPAALAALNAVRAKVDDYFARCRLAAFDPRALAAVNRQEAEYLAIAAKDMTVTAQEIAGFPLSRIEAGRALPLTAGINPAWSGALATFAAAAVGPVLGKDKTTLTEADWAQLKAKFGAHESWSVGRAGDSVEKLGLKRVREILAGRTRDALAALIAQDRALEPEMNAIINVERLARYYRDLHRLLNNFVSFTDFYSRKRKATFQAGVLYLDQRSCDLVLTVEDAGRHAAMAGLAGAYLAYCDCVRKATGEKISIVAAFTDGDSDNLLVGRNGLFYDRKGRDWDATITKIIDNPISIRQACFAPYKKLVRIIEEQVAKRAAAADAAADQQLAAFASTTANADKTKPPEPHKFDTGTLAAIGLVLTTLLGALGGIFGRILGLEWWQIPLALLAIIFTISTPSIIIAWLKLRKRNLGPILDANGWAVNARARINVPFGGSLTQVATLPANSVRSLDDPFAEKPNPWPKIITVLVILVFAAAILRHRGVWTRLKHNFSASKPAAAQTPTSPASPAVPAAK